MLGRTIALAFLALAAGLPASAAGTAYDRAASMAAGETPLSKGYDGSSAAGAVRAAVLENTAGAATEFTRSAAARASMNAAAVPSPEEKAGKAAESSTTRRLGFVLAGAIVGSSLAGPVGGLIGAALGFGVALMLSKLLG